eukprot:jgi/Chlat1/7765/Chrsp66S07232
MFCYLSKKVAIPNGVPLRCLAWNRDQGWIAAGGEHGLLKVGLCVCLLLEETNAAAEFWVLKLDGPSPGRTLTSTTTSSSSGLSSSSSTTSSALSMNQTLEGHGASVSRAAWNGPYRKLTTADGAGLIIVWMLHKGMWFEEMINNRNKSVVRDMKWTGDGQKICIAYEDGAVIVGSVDGNRLWGKELPIQLALGAMVQFYSYLGLHVRTLRIPGSSPSLSISALAWEGGGLRVALAVESFIYFANIRPEYRWGWMGGNKTLVYAFVKGSPSNNAANNSNQQAEQSGAHCVVFWNTDSHDRYAKFVKKLVAIKAAGEHCVLATKGEEDNQWILVLCNAIGSPVDSKYISVEPLFITMTSTHVVVCSEELVYVWSFGSRGAKGGVGVGSVDSSTSAGVSSLAASLAASLAVSAGGIMELNCTSSRLAVIDISGALWFHLLATDTSTTETDNPNPNPNTSTATTTNNNNNSNSDTSNLLTARKECWAVRWSADDPLLLAVAEKARMYVLRGDDGDPEEPVASSAYLCSFQNLEVKGVLMDEVMRTPDNPDKECVVEYEARSLRDTRHILQHVGLTEAYAFVDANPHPRLWRIIAEHALSLLEFSTAEKAYGIQLVKRVRSLSSSSSSLPSSTPHSSDPLQQQRAEVAAYLGRFDDAEEELMSKGGSGSGRARPDLAAQMRARMGDWFAVDRILQQHGGGNHVLQSEARRRIADYYWDRHRWRQAAKFYSLALSSTTSTDTSTPSHQHTQQQQQQQALLLRLAECHYYDEDYESLRRLAIEDGTSDRVVLVSVAEKLTSVGLCEGAVEAYVRAGDVRAAVDACVLLNHWDRAVQLAEKHSFSQIEGLLSKYANYLIEKRKPLQAVELYRRANKHTDAAKLLTDIARDLAAQKASPLHIKKLYVLAGLQVEAFRKKTLDAQLTPDTFTSTQAPASGSGGFVTAYGPSRSGSTGGAQATLDGLVAHERATAGNKFLEGAWRGAEAYHLWMVAHRQLYAGDADGAVAAALRLREYEDILDPVRHPLACQQQVIPISPGRYGQASRALVALESLPAPASSINSLNINNNAGNDRREAYAAVAMAVFTRHPPQDPKGKGVACPSCRAASIQEWHSRCPNAACGASFPMCVATGRTIIQESQATLDGLVAHERATAGNKFLEGAWRGAEAYHLWMVAHRQLYAGDADGAVAAALRLREYEDILDPVDVHSLGALASLAAGRYGQASRALVALESLPAPASSINSLNINNNAGNDRREAYAAVAMAVFTRHPPQDPKGKGVACPSCRAASIQEWHSRCPNAACGASFPMCVATGRTIIQESQVGWTEMTVFAGSHDGKRIGNNFPALNARTEECH